MYGAPSLSSAITELTFALFPPTTRPPSRGGVILGPAMEVDKFFDIAEFSLTRLCIRVQRVRKGYTRLVLQAFFNCDAGLRRLTSWLYGQSARKHPDRICAPVRP